MSGEGPPAPDVTVVIPVRDGAGVVVDACRSALAQTGVRVEVLVVENGSTDDTVERVRSVGDPRVGLLTQDPPGVSRARNLGVERAAADWVAFLDADDRWASGKLRRQLDAAGDADLVFSDMTLERAGTPLPQSFHQVNPPPPDLARLLPELVSRPNFVPLSTVLVRRSVVLAVGGFREDLSHSEDWDLWLRLALAGATAAAVPERLTTYGVSPDGASRDVRAIYRGEVASLRPLLPVLAQRGCGPAAARRLRTAEQLAVVYGRRASAPAGERWHDLWSLVRSRGSVRSCAAQLAYTLLPSRAGRSRASL